LAGFPSAHFCFLACSLSRPPRTARHAGGSTLGEHDGRDEEPLILNGLVVDTRIAALMRRADWPGERTSPAWLERFPTAADSTLSIPFVKLCGADQASRENANLRNPELANLCGRPDPASPPGDFDPTAGYLIGFTDHVDAGVFVDLRGGGRITYDNLANPRFVIATAFNSIEAFVDFYLAQHGE
jgi:hypothetical protein